MDYLKQLLKIEWQEGKKVPLPSSSYRTRTVIYCSAVGRQRAEFASGYMGNYFAYIEILTNRRWVLRGAIIIPVLPDGRFLMVVEQRPPQYVFETKPPTHIEFVDHRVELAQFGPYSSLEFPGGGIHPEDMTIFSGALRELSEEAGVANQRVTVFSHQHPIYPMGSDIALEGYSFVVYLSDERFPAKVKNDGGLRIFALTFDEVELNRRLGVFAGGTSGLLAWAFYKEIEEAKRNGELSALENIGYIVQTTARLEVSS